MTTAIDAVRNLSKDLGINEDTIMRESILEYIKSKIRACMKDQLEIMSRYRVSSMDEFEKKVKDGSIPEHPGWEDLIVLENLNNSINKLKEELLHVRNISTS
jgi:hypothetical protein